MTVKTYVAALAMALCARGLELGYNLDHDEALETFKAAIAADPANPTPYRLAAATEWVRMLFSQGAITAEDFLGQANARSPRPKVPQSIAASFETYLARAEALSQAELRLRPSDPTVHFQVGAAAGFRASYIGTIEGRIMSALGPARRAYNEHERVLELDPARKDAGLIVGMYRYAVSELPAPKRVMARLIGFGGGRERGLRMVEEASRYTSDVQVNALFTLIVMYNREKRHDDALRVIAELQRRFPRNRLLWLEQGSTALRAGRLAEARLALEHGFEMLEGDRRPRAFDEDARWRAVYAATFAAPARAK